MHYALQTDGSVPIVHSIILFVRLRLHCEAGVLAIPWMCDTSPGADREATTVFPCARRLNHGRWRWFGLMFMSTDDRLIERVIVQALRLVEYVYRA